MNTEHYTRLLQKYFQAFEAKDLEAITALFSPKITLQDPFVGLVEGYQAVRKLYQQMFEVNSFSLRLGRCYSNKDGAAYEFHLEVTQLSDGKTQKLSGVDCFEFTAEVTGLQDREIQEPTAQQEQPGQIRSIRAYLDLL
ncbi:MAG: nuclear transport factor 2 family protein [Bdellovibrionales bacterium]|nr:nuclear transport factor 2 family protein [Bdellovibrionales bacterium]